MVRCHDCLNITCATSFDFMTTTIQLTAGPKIKNPILRVAVLLICLVSLFCHKSASHKSRHFFRLDTMVRITLAEKPSNSAKLWHTIDSVLLAYENHYSYSDTSSLLWDLNQNKLSRIRVSSDLYRMLRISCAFAETTTGYFDPTILPLKKAWGLTSTTHSPQIRPPDSAFVDSVLTHIGYDRIDFDSAERNIIFTDSLVEIDMGGIAKGFAIQALDSVIKSFGIYDFLIDAGGDILVRGNKSDGSKWIIGIRHPRESGIIARIEPEEGTIVTSGDYERYVVIDSIRYCHILNPHTGYPCRRYRSVSVWSPNPVRADVLSTAFFCMPRDSVFRFVNRRDSLHCMLIDSLGTIHISDGWEKQMHVYE